MYLYLVTIRNKEYGNDKYIREFNELMIYCITKNQ